MIAHLRYRDVGVESDCARVIQPCIASSLPRPLNMPDVCFASVNFKRVPLATPSRPAQLCRKGAGRFLKLSIGGQRLDLI